MLQGRLPAPLLQGKDELMLDGRGHQPQGVVQVAASRSPGQGFVAYDGPVAQINDRLIESGDIALLDDPPQGLPLGPILDQFGHRILERDG
ncbi:MAG: hypothetical protein MUF69_08855 [Desulfobacterota bacterium]|jgi:hypothetical protein|nr:hypothetical protein [Thermodesulfobacteriota bacterium]